MACSHGKSWGNHGAWEHLPASRLNICSRLLYRDNAHNRQEARCNLARHCRAVTMSRGGNQAWAGGGRGPALSSARLAWRRRSIGLCLPGGRHNVCSICSAVFKERTYRRHSAQTSQEQHTICNRSFLWRRRKSYMVEVLSYDTFCGNFHLLC